MDRDHLIKSARAVEVVASNWCILQTKCKFLEGHVIAIWKHCSNGLSHKNYVRCTYTETQVFILRVQILIVLKNGWFCYEPFWKMNWAKVGILQISVKAKNSRSAYRSLLLKRGTGSVSILFISWHPVSVLPKTHLFCFQLTLE